MNYLDFPFQAKTHVTALSFSPDGKQFVTVSPDRKVRLATFFVCVKKLLILQTFLFK